MLGFKVGYYDHYARKELYKWLSFEFAQLYMKEIDFVHCKETPIWIHFKLQLRFQSTLSGCSPPVNGKYVPLYCNFGKILLTLWTNALNGRFRNNHFYSACVLKKSTYIYAYNLSGEGGSSSGGGKVASLQFSRLWLKLCNCPFARL